MSLLTVQEIMPTGLTAPPLPPTVTQRATPQSLAYTGSDGLGGCWEQCPPSDGVALLEPRRGKRNSRDQGQRDASRDGVAVAKRSSRKEQQTTGPAGAADADSDPDAAFDRWYREQRPRVLAALTVASGSPDVAAEATDEAFVKAYERWGRVRRMDSPGGWLHKVAFNDLRRRHRRKAIERELLKRDGPPSSVAPPALDPQLWEAVRRLPARQRTAVGLRYVLDLRETEVARLMGVTRGSASASLTAARRQLEHLLGSSGDGADTPTAARAATVGTATVATTARPEAGIDHG